MNTKILLLLIIFSVGTYSVFSTARNFKSVYGSGSQTTQNLLSSSASDNDSFPFNNLWNSNCTDTTNHNTDDDAKSHDIHYERFAEHKRKMFFCIIGKIVLIVSYLCSLLSFCIHN